MIPEAVCIIPNCGKRCPASEPFCSDHRSDDKGHEWFLPPMIGHICCRKCGLVRRRDGTSNTCRGVVRVALRDEYTEGAAAVTAEPKVSPGIDHEDSTP